jgi:hypothetical protein
MHAQSRSRQGCAFVKEGAKSSDRKETMINEIEMETDVWVKAHDELSRLHPDLGIFGECLLANQQAAPDMQEISILTIDDSHPVAQCVRSVILRHELDKALGLI